MIAGLGMDVVSVSRIAGQLASPTAVRFLERVYTARERAYCDARPAARAVHYAARWAAKEAASKALGVPSGIRFLDVEVSREQGAPSLLLSGAAAAAAARRGVQAVHLTLTHDGDVAAATVILEAAGG